MLEPQIYSFYRSGATRFINKPCSVFRGNIGSEFDAMLDALQEEFAVVVLGFPKNTFLFDSLRA